MNIKEKIKINQKGAISIFTVLAMLFFLLAVFGVYMFVSRRGQTQQSSLVNLKSMYKEDAGKIYDSLAVDNLEETALIEIYGKNDFNDIGNNIIKTINKKNFVFSKENKYILKNDIINNVSDIYGKNLKPKDYTMYDITNFNVSKSSYESYYMYDKNSDGTLEKYILVAYSLNPKTKGLNLSSNIATEEQFSILENTNFYYEKYKIDGKYNFLTLDIVSDTQYYYTETKETFPKNVSELTAFSRLDNTTTSYYVFLEVK